MKKTALIILLAASLNMMGQITTKEGINIEVVKSKLVDNVSVFGVRQLKVKTDELRKVMIKTKISSNPDDKTRLSAFSLVDTVNKIRYRLADYKGYTGVIGAPELIPFRKSQIFDKKGNPVDNYSQPPYEPSEKDYFNDFDMPGYRNFELPINFGTKEKPQLSIVYFGKTEYKKFTAELYFALITANTDLPYELYYKDEKIADIRF